MDEVFETFNHLYKSDKHNDSVVVTPVISAPDIDDVVTAFTSLSQSIHDEKNAREKHNGYSWDYHGSNYINEVEKYRALCASRLEAYIDYRIEAKLKAIFRNQ